MGQVVKWLPNKNEVLTSNSDIAKRKRRKKKKIIEYIRNLLINLLLIIAHFYLPDTTLSDLDDIQKFYSESKPKIRVVLMQ
jgi:hypothetical protein